MSNGEQLEFTEELVPSDNRPLHLNDELIASAED